MSARRSRRDERSAFAGAVRNRPQCSANVGKISASRPHSGNWPRVAAPRTIVVGGGRYRQATSEFNRSISDWGPRMPRAREDVAGSAGAGSDLADDKGAMAIRRRGGCAKPCHRRNAAGRARFRQVSGIGLVRSPSQNAIGKLVRRTRWRQPASEAATET